jgi:hypothetical protein
LVGSGLVLTLLGGAGLVASLPASAQPANNPAPTVKAGEDDAVEFAKLDKNKDGFIDKTEAMAEPKLIAKWKDVDVTNRGKINKDEFMAFEKKEHANKTMK